MATLRRVTKEEIAREEIQQIWRRADAGERRAISAMNYWHRKFPELKVLYSQYVAARNFVGPPRPMAKVKRPPPKSRALSPWSKAQQQFLTSGKSTAHEVSGGLPTLGKRR